MEKAEPIEAPKAPLRTTFNLPDLPTSDEGLEVGDVWNNRGTLNIKIRN